MLMMLFSLIKIRRVVENVPEVHSKTGVMFFHFALFLVYCLINVFYLIYYGFFMETFDDYY